MALILFETADAASAVEMIEKARKRAVKEHAKETAEEDGENESEHFQQEVRRGGRGADGRWPVRKKRRGYACGKGSRGNSLRSTGLSGCVGLRLRRRAWKKLIRSTRGN
jgi:hypothetical protein